MQIWTDSSSLRNLSPPQPLRNAPLAELPLVFDSFWMLFGLASSQFSAQFRIELAIAEALAKMVVNGLKAGKGLIPVIVRSWLVLINGKTVSDEFARLRN